MTQTPERKKQYAKERRERDGDQIRRKQAEWRDKNRDKLKAAHRKRRKEKRAMCLVAAARIRARRKIVPFMLQKSDIDDLQIIIDKGVCQLTGVSLTLDDGLQSTSPSLDRIIPELGYVPDNVRIVCHAVNAGMGQWGEEELFRIVRGWVKRHQC